MIGKLGPENARDAFARIDRPEIEVFVVPGGNFLDNVLRPQPGTRIQQAGHHHQSGRTLGHDAHHARRRKTTRPGPPVRTNATTLSGMQHRHRPHLPSWPGQPPGRARWRWPPTSRLDMLTQTLPPVRRMAHQPSSPDRYIAARSPRPPCDNSRQTAPAHSPVSANPDRDNRARYPAAPGSRSPAALAPSTPLQHQHRITSAMFTRPIPIMPLRNIADPSRRRRRIPRPQRMPIP